MSVPFFDLGIQHSKLELELRGAFERVLKHGKFILGPEVQEFEDAVAQCCKARFAISCASGSDALLLALMALGIGRDDEVITSPYSFFATASCIARLGAKAVFVDIDPLSYNLDPQGVLRKITSKTKAIIPVHLYGQSAEMEPYLHVARSKGIAIVEDAAQAIGARFKGQPVGGVGDVGCLSFFPTKNLGGLGDGGMMLTQDETLAERLQVLRVHGSKPKYMHHLLGINSRLDTLQAAWLKVKLTYLESWSTARCQNAKRYVEMMVERGLADESPVPFGSTKPLVLPHMGPHGHVFNQFVISTTNPSHRDLLRVHLQEQGIGTEIYYPLPLHLQPCFKSWDYRKGDFPISERAASSTLALPIFPELTGAHLRQVVDAIESFRW